VGSTQMFFKSVRFDISGLQAVGVKYLEHHVIVYMNFTVPCQIPLDQWKGAWVCDPKYAKFGHICNFWPSKSEMMQSTWNFTEKCTPYVRSCMQKFSQVHEQEVWQPTEYYTL